MALQSIIQIAMWCRAVTGKLEACKGVSMTFSFVCLNAKSYFVPRCRPTGDYLHHHKYERENCYCTILTFDQSTSHTRTTLKDRLRVRK